jgi:hypothetical protein
MSPLSYEDLLAQNNRQAEQIQVLQKMVEELANDQAFYKETIQQLRDEIAFLKGQKPRPKIPPSVLEGPKSKDKDIKPRISRGHHPRKKKKALLVIQQEQVIQPTLIPPDAVSKGYKTYDVQDIIFTPKNTRYLLARWQLPDGTYICGELPKGIKGHYGPELISYILNDYYACRVTEHLLLKKLHDRGVLISAGQLNNILIHGKESFHQEKQELLPAGIMAQNQIQTDDTGARHKGKNQYTNVIGNDLFTVFNTTDSKNRINFLGLLQNGKHEYLLNEDAVEYLRIHKAPFYLYVCINNGYKFTTLADWEKFLAARNITLDFDVRIMTEAALFASVIERGIPRNLGVHGDAAGQFDAFVRSLCWIHEERHYRKIIPIDDQARADLESVRDEFWEIYRMLKAYKDNPCEAAQNAINKRFDDLFANRITSSAILNKRLRMTYENKQALLRVLERPDTPLHNNSSETDARAVVTKRKISGGTRSDEGKEARDTFLSLKQTCRKLGLNFSTYLIDRLKELNEIPRLPEVIRLRAQNPPKPAPS